MKVRFLLTKAEFEAIQPLRPQQGETYIEALFDADFDPISERADIREKIEELSNGDATRVIVGMADLLQIVQRINKYVVTDDLDGF